MVPLAVPLSLAPVLAYGDGVVILNILVTTIITIVCAAIPLTAGMARGHVTMGIIGALLTVPAAAAGGCLFGFVTGLPVAALFTIIIKLLPAPNRPLLTQAEVEQEMRRVRGY